MAYKHSFVVHKEEFVKKDGEHTKTIESVWAQMKLLIKNMHGVSGELLFVYLKISYIDITYVAVHQEVRESSYTATLMHYNVFNNFFFHVINWGVMVSIWRYK